MFILALNSEHGHFHILGHIARSALGNTKLLEVVGVWGAVPGHLNFIKAPMELFVHFKLLNSTLSNNWQILVLT